MNTILKILTLIVTSILMFTSSVLIIQQLSPIPIILVISYMIYTIVKIIKSGDYDRFAVGFSSTIPIFISFILFMCSPHLLTLYEIELSEISNNGIMVNIKALSNEYKTKLAGVEIVLPNDYIFMDNNKSTLTTFKILKSNNSQYKPYVKVIKNTKTGEYDKLQFDIFNDYKFYTSYSMSSQNINTIEKVFNINYPRSFLAKGVIQLQHIYNINHPAINVQTLFLVLLSMFILIAVLSILKLFK